MNIYELYGRQAEKMAEMVQYHRATQQLLFDLFGGRILPSQLVITQEGWSVGEVPSSQEPEHIGRNGSRASKTPEASGAG